MLFHPANDSFNQFFGGGGAGGNTYSLFVYEPDRIKISVIIDKMRLNATLSCDLF